jgi:hypothetical protein
MNFRVFTNTASTMVFFCSVLVYEVKEVYNKVLVRIAGNNPADENIVAQSSSLVNEVSKARSSKSSTLINVLKFLIGNYDFQTQKFAAIFFFGSFDDS